MDKGLKKLTGNNFDFYILMIDLELVVLKLIVLRYGKSLHNVCWNIYFIFNI